MIYLFIACHTLFTCIMIQYFYHKIHYDAKTIFFHVNMTYSIIFQWEPVQYFNNKIICDLVETKPTGIISIMVCMIWQYLNNHTSFCSESIIWSGVKMLWDVSVLYWLCMVFILQDEECLRPGNATDDSFLEKLSTKLGGHPHYLSYTTANVQDRRSIGRNVSEKRSKAYW